MRLANRPRSRSPCAQLTPSAPAWLSWLGRYINYPTQVLVKSCKMVPVMAANMLMGIHHYSHAAKLRVLLLTTGICAFLLAKPAEPEHAAHHDGSEAERLKATGLALALASLACDGYTGGAQDRLVHAVRPTSHQLMLWTNLWAMGLLAAALALSGQGVLAVRFAARHPEMITDLALFCGTSALGQNFIYFSIARFGALPTAVITTTRKFFTILASVLWFGHPVSATQWLSILLVFAALGSELYQKLIASKNHGRFHGGGAHAPLAPNERRPGERRGSDASSVEMGQLTDGDNGDATIGMLSAPPSDMEDDDDDEAADSARANGLLNGPALEMARTPYETVRLLGLMKQRSSSSARLPELAGPRLFEKEQRPQMREV